MLLEFKSLTFICFRYSILVCPFNELVHLLGCNLRKLTLMLTGILDAVFSDITETQSSAPAEVHVCRLSTSQHHLVYEF